MIFEFCIYWIVCLVIFLPCVVCDVAPLLCGELESPSKGCVGGRIILGSRNVPGTFPEGLGNVLAIPLDSAHKTTQEALSPGL